MNVECEAMYEKEVYCEKENKSAKDNIKGKKNKKNLTVDLREEKDNKKKRNNEKKIIFWNVAGLGNKDREFWEVIQNFDLVSLSETWVGLKEKDYLEKNWLKNLNGQFFRVKRFIKKEEGWEAGS